MRLGLLHTNLRLCPKAYIAIQGHPIAASLHINHCELTSRTLTQPLRWTALHVDNLWNFPTNSAGVTCSSRIPLQCGVQVQQMAPRRSQPPRFGLTVSSSSSGNFIGPLRRRSLRRGEPTTQVGDISCPRPGRSLAPQRCISAECWFPEPSLFQTGRLTATSFHIRTRAAGNIPPKFA